MNEDYEITECDSCYKLIYRLIDEIRIKMSLDGDTTQLCGDCEIHKEKNRLH